MIIHLCLLSPHKQVQVFRQQQQAAIIMMIMIIAATGQRSSHSSTVAWSPARDEPTPSWSWSPGQRDQTLFPLLDVAEQETTNEILSMKCIMIDYITGRRPDDVLSVSIIILTLTAATTDYCVWRSLSNSAGKYLAYFVVWPTRTRPDAWVEHWV